MLSNFGSCSYVMSSDSIALNEHSTVWNADNIPLPHLTDGRLYVSNPDTVIRQETVDSLNSILFDLDKKVGIESAVIIVNYIENQDAFRMAQDVGNKYGVGKKETNRGLVIVVSYQDHKYFIAPGRGLESDLTDAECGRLARTYLTPYMREENPDGAMLSLVKATYALTVEKRILEGPSEDPHDDVFLHHGVMSDHLRTDEREVQVAGCAHQWNRLYRIRTFPYGWRLRQLGLLMGRRLWRWRIRWRLRRR